MFNQQKPESIMNSNEAKEYGEFVDITAPIEAESSSSVLGGEIWYN